MKKYIILVSLLFILLVTLSVPAQVIPMRIPDSTVVSGNNIDIPVYASSTLTGNNILSYVLQLNFNQSYLQVLSVITTGTISSAFGSPAVNTAIPGLVTIAGAGATPLTGSGKFIYIRFKALQPGGIGVNFSGVQNNYFNEGNPSMSFDNGIINITAPPFISISPNNGIITKGETLQFSVSGGTAPYQWFVTNPGVASVSATGLLTGTQAGFTKVFVIDNLGLRDTTNSLIEIRAMRLSIPTNLSQWQGSDINVPVNTTDLTGLNIFSGNFNLTFNPNILTPTGIVQTGTLLASYAAPLINTGSPGTISLDFAGTTALSGSGTLIYITFHVSPVNTGGTALNFGTGLFNEDLLPNFTNGYFSTINLPVLSLTPFSGSLVAGQTQQFTLNGGGTPPIVWSISNPQVASISQTGLMTTIKGGNITVTATDVHGAYATTGNWLVYDTHVIMPDTTTCTAAGEFYYPVVIRSLPAGESVFSFQATISYNSTYLTFQNLETTGTLSQNWTFVTNPLPNQVSFAGSGATSFNTPGILVKLRFLLNPAFVLGSSALLQLTSITLNEGVPNPLVDINGYISGVNPNLPVSVAVSASANPVNTGFPVTFTATPTNGGPNPSYQWKVNSAIVPGATNSTYTYMPANSDAINCVLTSNAPCIVGNPATSNTITMVVTTVPVNNTVSGTVTNSQTKCYNASNIITVAGGGTSFTVQSGGSVTMIAGQSIDYLPGTTVMLGGYMHGYIAPGGPFCISPSSPSFLATRDDFVPDIKQSIFKVFPNPSTGVFNFSLNGDIETGPLTMEVFGMQGEKIISSTFSGEIKDHSFSLSAQPAGVYFVRLISGKYAETLKVIRQ